MFHCFFCVCFFALSIERTCPDLHFTTDYTLYDYVCDVIIKNLEPSSNDRAINLGIISLKEKLVSESI